MASTTVPGVASTADCPALSPVPIVPDVSGRGLTSPAGWPSAGEDVCDVVVKWRADRRTGSDASVRSESDWAVAGVPMASADVVGSVSSGPVVLALLSELGLDAAGPLVS